MKLTTFLLISLVAIILLISMVVIIHSYIKQNTLEDIRADVYQAFLQAERVYKHGDNANKLKYVIQQARGLLPSWARIFITDAVLEKVIDLWFLEVKDLLDDGKLNQSAKEE